LKGIRDIQDGSHINMTAQHLTFKLILRQQAQRPNLRNSTYLTGGYETAAQAAAIGSPIYQKSASLLFLLLSQALKTYISLIVSDQSCNRPHEIHLIHAQHRPTHPTRNALNAAMPIGSNFLSFEAAQLYPLFRPKMNSSSMVRVIQIMVQYPIRERKFRKKVRR
jgi:hypothetical protein